VTHVLMGLALIAVYILLVLVRPQKPCRRCRGWGVKGRARRACPRCQGTGTHFRFGAPTIHRGKALVIRYVRERLRAE
jgi:hypothetical protein